MTNNPKKVILHCAATGDYKTSKFNIGHIRQWHLEKGWTDVGYHKYIDRNGNIQQGRNDNIVGAHCKGHNQDSIGVCYEGSYFPTAYQWDSIFNLYRSFRDIYKINHTDWFAHNEFDPGKECPGFSGEILRKLLAKIA